MPPLPITTAPKGPAAPPPGAPSPAAAGGPPAGPMVTPQQNEGVQKAARVQIQLAVQVLQRQLANFPLESDENKAILSALKTLSNAFGKSEDKDRELIPAEVMQLLSQVGPKAGPPGAGAAGAAPLPGVGAPAPGPA